MKSSDMKISVCRGDDGVPRFKYPSHWDGDTIFLQICELCCRLSEELKERNQNA